MKHKYTTTFLILTSLIICGCIGPSPFRTYPKYIKQVDNNGRYITESTSGERLTFEINGYSGNLSFVLSYVDSDRDILKYYYDNNRILQESSFFVEYGMMQGVFFDCPWYTKSGMPAPFAPGKYSFSLYQHNNLVDSYIFYVSDSKEKETMKYIYDFIARTKINSTE